MNANELAEILKENPTFIISLQNRIEEQEKEIEALKDKLGIQNHSDNQLLKAVSKIKEQAKEIEVLNQSYKILFKHRIEQEKLIEQLKNKKIIGLEDGEMPVISFPVHYQGRLGRSPLSLSETRAICDSITKELRKKNECN